MTEIMEGQRVLLPLRRVRKLGREKENPDGRRTVGSGGVQNPDGRRTGGVGEGL